MKHLLILTLCISLVSGKTFASQAVPLENGTATIILEDHVKHPLYWWPQTLLSYELDTDQTLSPSELAVTSEGRQVPFQLFTETATDNGRKTCLHLLSGLPSGGKLTFRLQKGNSSRRHHI